MQAKSKKCKPHSKPCQYMCTFSKCQDKLICEKCKRDHLQLHPDNFIYDIEFLIQIYTSNKVDKLKERMIKEKHGFEQQIQSIYTGINDTMKSLSQSFGDFTQRSRKMVEEEMTNYLKENKALISAAEQEFTRGSTEGMSQQALNQMLERTLKDAEQLKKVEKRIQINSETFKCYIDSTRGLFSKVKKENESMATVFTRIMQNSEKNQQSRFTINDGDTDSAHELSFYKRYTASREVSKDSLKLQSEVIEAKRFIQYKDIQMKIAQDEVKLKVNQIKELQSKIETLSDQLLRFEQNADRDRMHKMEQVEREGKKKLQILIKSGVIGEDNKSLFFDEKQIDDLTFPAILVAINSPELVDLSSHRLRRQQLMALLSAMSELKTLKFNFSGYDEQFLLKLFQKAQNLTHLELNSIAPSMPSSSTFTSLLKQSPRGLLKLHLMDNSLTDQQLSKILSVCPVLSELYVSFNNLTGQAIESINRNSYQIKVLHISRNRLGQKGGLLIGKYLKHLEELFIGNTGLTKEGVLSVFRNCQSLKRLSLVGNESVRELLSELLLQLESIEWLDISYCRLSETDSRKIQKIGEMRAHLTIVSHQ